MHSIPERTMLTLFDLAIVVIIVAAMPFVIGAGRNPEPFDLAGRLPVGRPGQYRDGRVLIALAPGDAHATSLRLRPLPQFLRRRGHAAADRGQPDGLGSQHPLERLSVARAPQPDAGLPGHPRPAGALRPGHRWPAISASSRRRPPIDAASRSSASRSYHLRRRDLARRQGRRRSTCGRRRSQT